MLLPTTPARACRICALASGAPPFHGYDRAWAEDELYFALVSVGALVPGWSLVFPKNHSHNLSRSYSDESLWSFVDRAHAAVERRYGQSVVFEHGSQYEGSQTGCGTSHAHLHIVPLGAGLMEAARNYDPSLQWQPCSAKDIHQKVAGREYLFVADRYRSAATFGNLALLEEGRSQFFRRVIASMLGRPTEFDYRQHPQAELANASTAQLLRDGAYPLQASAA